MKIERNKKRPAKGRFFRIRPYTEILVTDSPECFRQIAHPYALTRC